MSHAIFDTRVCVLAAQSCLTLCKTMDCSPPGSSTHGILQARILEWVAIPFSRASSWPRDLPHYRQILNHLSHQGSLIRHIFTLKNHPLGVLWVQSLVRELRSHRLCGGCGKKTFYPLCFWNANLTGHLTFLFAKSGSPEQWGLGEGIEMASDSHIPTPSFPLLPESLRVSNCCPVPVAPALVTGHLTGVFGGQLGPAA